MIIIAIEGIDGVGKGTQSKLLTERLIREGYKAELVSFPDYNSPYGQMIGEYLNGKYGNFDQVHPKLISTLYAHDRKYYFSRCNYPDILIADRYTYSNIAHQAAKFTIENRAHFIDWLFKFEHMVLAIPAPVVNVVLNAPLELTIKQTMLKNKRTYTDNVLDIHESNVDYLKIVKSIYETQDNTFYNSVIIDCNDGDKIMPVNEISDKIFSYILEYVE